MTTRELRWVAVVLWSLCGCTDEAPDCVGEHAVASTPEPCVRLHGAPGLAKEFTTSGTVTQVTDDTTGWTCSRHDAATDSLVSIEDGAGNLWTIHVDFALDVEVGDEVDLAHDLHPGTLSSLTLRTREGSLLLWYGSWEGLARHPLMPEEIGDLSPTIGFAHCKTSSKNDDGEVTCRSHIKKRGYAMTLDGIEGEVPYDERTTLGAFDVQGVANLDTGCHGDVDSYDLIVVRR